MDIKVGEYIRTNEGEIFKVGRINDDYFVSDRGLVGCFEDMVTNNNSNIIHLLEVGDIIKIEDEYEDVLFLVLDGVGWLRKVKFMLLNKHWKLISIVTKEQFKAMEYEV